MDPPGRCGAGRRSPKRRNCSGSRFELVVTGEIELEDDDIQGLAVHIGARVAALARASEICVSSTVKDLTGGSDLVFEDAGEYAFKGVPDNWHLFKVLA